MTWVLLGVAAWLVCALLAALVVVRAIRTAELRECSRRRRAHFASNFTVDDGPGAPAAAPPAPRQEESPVVRESGTGASTGSPSGPTGGSR